MAESRAFYPVDEAFFGSAKARNLYARGVDCARKSDAYDQKNYEYYYDFQKHYEPYERKGKRCFEKAAEYFGRAAALGCAPAMLMYAQYLFAFRDEASEAFGWFLKASEAGIVVADYQLAAFYANGYGGVTADAARAREYFERFRAGCDRDLLQSFTSWGMDESMRACGRTFLYAWFCGDAVPLLHDTPRARPSRWKYEKL